MLALVYDPATRSESIRSDYPTPTPLKTEALVQVRMAGICRTDLEILAGYMDFEGVMGHEFVGTVVEGPQKWKNKRVVAEINCVCEKCDMCTSGLSSHCRNRTVLGIDRREGVFAEYLTVPIRNLHELPDNVSDIEGVFVEPLSAAFQVVRQVDVDRMENVVVLGDGRLGQLIARVLKMHPGRLVLVGKHAEKLEAAEKQGIQTAHSDQFAPRGEADLVVDATGTPSGLELAMRTVRPRGTIILKSTFTEPAQLDLTPLVVNEVTVIGSRCGAFHEAIRALGSPPGSPDHVDVSALVSKRFALTEGLLALEAAARSENLKVLLDVAN